MTHAARSIALRSITTFPHFEFGITDGQLSLLNCNGVSDRMISDVMSRIETPAYAPFSSGLLACCPLSASQSLIAEANGDRITCHVIPTGEMPEVIAELTEGRASPSSEPSIANLDRVEPLLRCVIAGQPLIAYGARPEPNVLTAWHMLPPSCRHELTFASQPFVPMANAVHFVADFDPSHVGPDSASMMLDLTSRVPLDLFDDAMLGWSIAIQSHILTDNPMEALRDFYGQYCQEASIRDLTQISEDWCAIEEGQRSAIQFADSTQFQNLGNGFVSSVDTADRVEVHKNSDDVLEQLGQLDDAVFDAIAGANNGLSRMRELWPKAKQQISDHLIDESREHYLRYVVNEWTHRFMQDADPVQCFPTIEVMRILLDHEQ
ncbi:MAG: hypothetical protein KDB27_00865 [Planctomycetales bacterium]|nr:hypothetical protein [Planctomycetales bacterium]